ncbi:MAG: aminoacyl--tRNA ligase-related protein, partial [Patescibacteria group bacterium]
CLSMRQSQLFTKTRREAPADEVSKNAQLLIRAGFVYKEMAGVYAFLPLGLRVLENIKNIVREEMNAAGGQELIMTALQRKELWEKTDRWSDEKVDVWFKSTLSAGGDVGFAWSHEEPISDMMKGYLESYRDLPVYVYQFQTKLRNELRAKSGVLRGREFVMKDLYSYTTDAAQHKEIYEAMIQAYQNVYRRIGLGDITFLTFASGGAFTQFSHEFQTVSDVGEDIIYIDTEKRIAVNKEVYTDEVLAHIGLEKEKLIEAKSIEVGNIFDFGGSKSEQLGLMFKDETGALKPVYLGSYGLGITRVMATIAEVMSDDKGLVWPEGVSPFRYHLVSLAGADETLRARADQLYDTLTEAGISVLYDDREQRAGEKFADSDLIGIPFRIVVGKNSTDTSFEVVTRSSGETRTMSKDELLQHS